MSPRVLDIARGLAALYVAAFHAKNLLWSDLPNDGLSPLALLVQHALGFGHEAVLIFFLISGFCIHYRQAQTGAISIDLPTFAWRRARRLYPPLLLALVLTSLFDSIGTQLNPAVYTGGTPYQLHQIGIHDSHSPLTLVGNLLFQAKLSVPEWGSNGPLWSLAFEFWFYALYPVALLGIRRLGPGRALAASWAISAGAGAVSLRVDGWPLLVLSLWAIWVTGAYLAELHARGAGPARLRRIGPVVLVPLAVMVVASPPGVVHDSFPDLVWGVWLSVLLAYVMLVPPARLAAWIDARSSRLRRLGDVSYSLYLLHHPWLALLAAVWLVSHPGLPIGPELALIGLLSALGLGWLGWYAVERHCVSRAAASPAAKRARIAPASA